jgi:2-aminoethylphosphonate dioxygenase
MTTATANRLSPSQTESYRRDGFLILRNAFPEGVTVALAAEADDLLARHAELIDKRNLRCRFQPHHETGECLFETFDPVVDIAPICRSVALDERITGAVADLYGEPACLFKDKLIFKPPGAKGYVLHQDYIAWPTFPRSFVTVLVPIDAADATNGCTECFPGYHHGGLLTPADGNFHELPAGAIDESKCVRLEIQPGDIAIFGGFTPHRSAPNRSRQWRRQLYLSYNALSDGGEQRDRHYADFHDYLRRKYGQHGVSDTHFR